MLSFRTLLGTSLRAFSPHLLDLEEASNRPSMERNEKSFEYKLSPNLVKSEI